MGAIGPEPICKECNNRAVTANAGIFQAIYYFYCRTCKIELNWRGENKEAAQKTPVVKSSPGYSYGYPGGRSTWLQVEDDEDFDDFEDFKEEYF